MTDHDPPRPGATDDVAADDVVELSAAERALLARWQPPGPPADFAARVLAPSPARRAGPARWIGATAVAAVATVTALVAWWPSSSATATVAAAQPRRIAVARETVPVGARGVAVVEPGAALAWQQVGRAIVVGQDAGDVFYRVDPGGPFTVVTPVGQVKVTGTCFRVEIIMSPTKHALLGGALGAVVATAAVVTVYEGKIIVVGDRGTQVASAGERTTLRPGAAPSPEAAPDRPPVGGGPATIALTLPAAPTDATTRDELLRRDTIQREQLAMLAKRVQELERGGGGGPGRPGGPRGLGEGSWLDPTPAELAAWAKECRVRIDLPPVMRGEAMKIPPDWAHDAGLTDVEVATANQVFADLATDWTRRVRGWYVEATGDAGGADALSAQAMGQELQEKAAPNEPQALSKRIAHERAGLVPPPDDLAKASPFERYFRAMAGLGEEAERLLADKLGAEKAHALRAHEGGWPMRMDMAGCDDDDGGADAPTPP